MAADDFLVNFAGATGVTATMKFDFTATGSDYYMDLEVTNTTPDPPGSAALTGFALSLPSSNGFGFLTYNPLASPFLQIVQPNPGGNVTLAPNIPYNMASLSEGTNLPPLGTFDFCFIDSGANCAGAGNGTTGLQPTDVGKVQFKIASTAGSTTAVSGLIKQFILDNQSAQPYAVATRWQGIGPNGGSDKVPGYVCPPTDPNCTPPPPAPGDEVPGPLPLFGAAAAFGYSRKIRRRLQASSLIS
ncbi:hypothetical protein [Synechococcus sp. CCY 0621]|uniref:hypothetical protein n=1 Tax=Synechococcus sp. CCY 0621 TaxID=2815603 RepID=UPI001C237A0E|nr:hypothetical protein [Synechococcus sp. CCY 0621]